MNSRPSGRTYPWTHPRQQRTHPHLGSGGGGDEGGGGGEENEEGGIEREILRDGEWRPQISVPPSWAGRRQAPRPTPSQANPAASAASSSRPATTSDSQPRPRHWLTLAYEEVTDDIRKELYDFVRQSLEALGGNRIDWAQFEGMVGSLVDRVAAMCESNMDAQTTSRSVDPNQGWRWRQRRQRAEPRGETRQARRPPTPVEASNTAPEDQQEPGRHHGGHHGSRSRRRRATRQRYNGPEVQRVQRSFRRNRKQCVREILEGENGRRCNIPAVELQTFFRNESSGRNVDIENPPDWWCDGVGEPGPNAEWEPRPISPGEVKAQLKRLPSGSAPGLDRPPVQSVESHRSRRRHPGTDLRGLPSREESTQLLEEEYHHPAPQERGRGSPRQLEAHLAAKRHLQDLRGHLGKTVGDLGRRNRGDLALTEGVRTGRRVPRTLLPGALHDGGRETSPPTAAPRVVRPKERLWLHPARPSLALDAKTGGPRGGGIHPDGRIPGIDIHRADSRGSHRRDRTGTRGQAGMPDQSAALQLGNRGARQGDPVFRSLRILLRRVLRSQVPGLCRRFGHCRRLGRRRGDDVGPVGGVLPVGTPRL